VKITWNVPIPGALNREREIALGERRLWATLGPQDFPREAVVTREDKRVFIDLFYDATPGERRLTIKRDDVRVTAGVASGRVLAIECPAEMDPDAIGRGIDRLRARDDNAVELPCPQRRSAHYDAIAGDVVPHIIEYVKDELVRESR
jgi:hypothetical protein